MSATFIIIVLQVLVNIGVVLNIGGFVMLICLTDHLVMVGMTPPIVSVLSETCNIELTKPRKGSVSAALSLIHQI